MNIKKIFAAFAGVALAAGAYAEVPIITFHTDLYATNGATNAFSFSIGGTPGYIDVDCGFGTVEYELKETTFDSTNRTIKATSVSGTVSAAGVVKIYGDAEAIDYLAVDGCYITSIDMPGLKNLQILNMEHNLLTGLDLSDFSKLQAIYLNDNPFSAETPLKIGANKPELALLQIGTIDYLDSSFNLSDYPAMVSFDAFGNRGLTSCDPTGCPELMQISIDNTPVESIDVSKNSKLMILNIADTKITSFDVSNNPALQQLYCGHGAAEFHSYKISSIDVSKNPELYYLFADYNNISTIDLSNNPKLFDLSLASNSLTNIDLSKNTNLYNVDLSRNYFNFATLPSDPGDWGMYYYGQRPMSLQRSYKVGDVIDFSTTMLRPGTETVATLYQVNEQDFSSPILISPSAYTFENGKLTLNQALPDSVYVSFDNSELSAYSLTTSNFVVKTAADYGKDTEAINFMPSESTGCTFLIGIAGASADNPVKFKVNNGSTTKEYTCTGSTLADASEITVSGYLIKILLPENVDITAFAIENQELYGLNLPSARSLKELKLTGTGLYKADLRYLYNLEYLELRGNHFYTLNLAGENRYFAKNRLNTLIIPGNEISEIAIEGFEPCQYIDASNNNLESFNFETARQASIIYVSGNNITSVNLEKCDYLVTAGLAHNNISEISLPTEVILANLDVSDNALTLATLPRPDEISGDYAYCGQANISIPETGPGIDLSSQYFAIDGNTTEYKLYLADGTLVSGSDKYTENNGKIKFVDTAMGDVYTVITNGAYPGLSLTTSVIKVAAMPTDVVASFTTPVGGQNVSVSLAAERMATFYVDWTGDGVELANYTLNTEYTLFSATTTAGANVKVYAYGDSAPLTVFSISGATMTNLDISRLTSLKTLSLSGAGLSEIQLPEGGTIAELALTDNSLSSIDLSGHPALTSLALSDNAFSGSFDLTAYKNLQLVSLAGNELSEVKINNPLLWFVDLSRNSLESIDLSGAPSLEQLSLAHNKLSNLDVSNLRHLKILLIDNNRFSFATLPAVNPSYVIYTYAKQAEIDAIVDGMTVDLSSQAMVGTTPTVYEWYLDMPVQDDEGNWEGEQLIVDDEYFIENGVTTFTTALRHLVCLMRNEEFPGVTLFSKMIDITAGISEVEATDAPVELYNLSGRRVNNENPAPGIYIRRQGSQVTKVYIR